MTSREQTVLRLAQTLLMGLPEVTEDLIRMNVQFAVDTVERSQGKAEIDVDALVRELRSRFNTTIGEGTIMEGSRDHLPWLPDRRAGIKWRFWDRYRQFLEDEQGWPESVVRQIHKVTDSVIERLEDPVREGKWECRGMVVGHVQSGKTANYTGLICKAVDAGYKLIIVLTGMHNSLRSQTQLRLDEGFLGFDTQRTQRFDANESLRIGVGLVPSSELLVAHSLTSSLDKGDFNSRVANQIGVVPGGADSVLLVVKKNKSVLENLLVWATMLGELDGEGKRIVRNVPLLVVDDEADNASVNTNPVPKNLDGSKSDEWDVSAINGCIRMLLDRFSRSAYVGYTATPFANIFIYPEGETPEHGRDLFPESFIVNLKPPSNYVGPTQLFGLAEEDSQPYPLIRTDLDDAEGWMPMRHKKHHVPGELPDSLRRAILSFILVCACRLARGHVNSHNSMLIHVTRFVDVQNHVYEKVTEYVDEVRHVLEYGQGGRKAGPLGEIEAIWREDFEKTSHAMRNMQACEEEIPAWPQIKSLLHEASSRIQYKRINGSAADVLDYRNHRNGLTVIAIGGDKLSRGLTLEGLSVSYFLRASRMYDTLMQMGRWFGYRPGYVDLCRIYTTVELREWYEFISSANEELRQEFDRMAEHGSTPREFGLRVRTHPDGLLITAANKMKSGTRLRVSFSRSLSETTIFKKDPEVHRRNFDMTDEFIAGLGSQYRRKGESYLWDEIAPEVIEQFLGAYEAHPLAGSASPGPLVDYIRARKQAGELTSWTVALASRQSAKNSIKIAGLDVGLIVRSDDDESSHDNYTLPKRHIVSPAHETLDLNEQQIRAALEETNRHREKEQKEPASIPSGHDLRLKRPANRGLLIIYPLDSTEAKLAGFNGVPVIGFAISFPESSSQGAVEYLVNNIYWNEEFGSQ